MPHGRLSGTPMDVAAGTCRYWPAIRGSLCHREAVGAQDDLGGAARFIERAGTCVTVWLAARAKCLDDEIPATLNRIALALESVKQPGRCRESWCKLSARIWRGG
jgi:hypothetical protein